MNDNNIIIKELEILNLKDRIYIINSDIDNNILKYKQFAIERPFLFFALLGGNSNKIDPLKKWTRKYIFEEAYIENEFDHDYVLDITNESLKRAKDEGAWFYTSEYFIEFGLIKLKIEFSYTEGEIDKIISTPYSLFNFDDFIEITYLLE